MKRWVLAMVAMVGLAFVALDILQRSDEDSRAEDSRTEPGKAAQPDSAPVNVIPERPRAERLEHARQLVTTLSQVDGRPGAFTPEKAEAWRRDLLALLDEGTAAVPAIAEFLQTNVDVRFDSGPGTKPLEERTLRLALIRVLFDIPTPDNVDLQVQVLRVTRDPDEVVLLAHQLEMQEKGKHRDAIIAAARASLDSVRKGEFPGRNTRELDKLLKQYQETVVK